MTRRRWSSTEGRRRRKPPTRRVAGCVAAVALAAVVAGDVARAATDSWGAVDERLERSVERIVIAGEGGDVSWPSTPPSLVARYTTEAAGGVSLAVGDNGESVYRKSFGSYTGDEVVGLASASKLPSVAAVMTLVDDGLLSLETTVAEYFPEYAGTVKGTITLAQMLSHTTGLPAQHVCMNNQAATTLDQCARDVLASELRHAPGTAFAYGGASFMIAGRIAELVTGQRWADLFAERIVSPLGITTWTFGDTENPRVPGGLESDIADYDRFLAMIEAHGMSGANRVLSESAIEAILSDRIGGLVIDGGRRAPFLGYGLGVWIEEADGNGRATEVSDPGAYGTWPWIDFARGYRAILLSDQPALVGQENKYVLQADIEPLIEAAVDA